MKIGITCFPLIGGSGILATALGMELAARGHTVHFFSYAKPVRLDLSAPRIHFHEVAIGEHSVFPCPDYTLPLAVQTCCGQPFFNSGYHEEARKLARHTIRAFDNGQFIVTPSGSCAAMIKLEYPELFHGDLVWHGRAEDCHDLAWDRYDAARTQSAISAGNRARADALRCRYDGFAEFAAADAGHLRTFPPDRSDP